MQKMDGMELTLQTSMEAATKRCGGMCASVALVVLGSLFNIKIENELYRLGLGIRFSGALGPASCIFSGTAAFIAHVARLQGLEQNVTIDLCGAWQHKYETRLKALPEATIESALALPLEILKAACEYFAESQQLPHLKKELLKPKEYYHNILRDREEMFRHNPYALEEKLKKAVIDGDKALALGTLREINARGEKAVLAKVPLRSAKNSMIGTIAFLCRATIQASVNTNDAFALSDALTQQVEEMADRNAILLFEEQILLQFIELVRHRIDEAYSLPVVKAIHYITNHLDGKISLVQAAAYAGVHPAYLSARFKKESGLPFTEYVAMRKIQESSYFVRHTNYPVSQIASLYGFSSQSYYITTFKKILGKTPMGYRKQALCE